MKKVDYSLYAITDRNLIQTDSLEEACRLAIEGGCSVLQLREKDSDGGDFYKRALEIKKLTEKQNIPLIINDRIDIALAVDADGVHLGQKDIPIDIARKLLGKEKIIGTSARTPEAAIKAEKMGADYLGVGAFFETSTKKDAKPVDLDLLRKIRKSVRIPIVVIGGINLERMDYFKDTGINGFAVVSALMAAEDIKKMAEKMKKKAEEII